MKRTIHNPYTKKRLEQTFLYAWKTKLYTNKQLATLFDINPRSVRRKKQKLKQLPIPTEEDIQLLYEETGCQRNINALALPKTYWNERRQLEKDKENEHFIKSFLKACFKYA